MPQQPEIPRDRGKGLQDEVSQLGIQPHLDQQALAALSSGGVLGLGSKVSRAERPFET